MALQNTGRADHSSRGGTGNGWGNEDRGQDRRRELKMEQAGFEFEEQVRGHQRREPGLGTGGAVRRLQPWRQVVAPYQDVVGARDLQTGFAADLWQAHLGQGSADYCDPVEFFRRTCLTAGLKRILIGALRRLGDADGPSVMRLEADSGAGKTHSMLALYHLFSGSPPRELSGIDALLRDAGLEGVPRVRRIVLAGNRISPANPVSKPDGTVVRTLWGELAWQLGGAAAHARVAGHDEKAANPADALRRLLVDHGPCLILIDEWVHYLRQLSARNDLQVGRWETQVAFARGLAEAASAVGNCLLVVSLPAGGPTAAHSGRAGADKSGGRRICGFAARLRSAVERGESLYRPASADERAEIARRRLFQPLSTHRQRMYRDVIARAFAALYQTRSHEFPPACAGPDYERRIRAAYPIHPEVFDVLDMTWSKLDAGQGLQGVLRLMAAVIHSLWEREDDSSLILPGGLPLDDARVRSELTRGLPAYWSGIIDQDVDGPHALPGRIDRKVRKLGLSSVTRRVARTVFFGSAAPSVGSRRGLDAGRTKLGCVLPGEAPSVFGTALQRLAAEAVYLHQNGDRYLYASRLTSDVSVMSVVEHRARQIRPDPRYSAQAISGRLPAALGDTDDFSRIHIVPVDGDHVPDDVQTCLVVLGTDHPHRSGKRSSAAEKAAAGILESCQAAPRRYRNALVFLAPDHARLQALDEAIRWHLAWKSILTDPLDLTRRQMRRVERDRDDAIQIITAQLLLAYTWLLTPVQKTPAAAGPVHWRATPLSDGLPLAQRAAGRLQKSGWQSSDLTVSRLRLQLDGWSLWGEGDHVPVRRVVESFARHLCMPRLQDPWVAVRRAVAAGVALPPSIDGIGYADGRDEKTGRYLGLRCGQVTHLADVAAAGLLVKSEAARRQIEDDWTRS